MDVGVWSFRLCILAIVQVTYLMIGGLTLVKRIDATTDPGDIEALKEVKAAVDSSTSTPFTCLGSWDFSFDPCDAKFSTHFTCGLDCDNENPANRRVTSLALDQSGYKGTLSPFVGNLSSLQELTISGNSFRGFVPVTLGHLSNLNKLDLSNNLFSGHIPSSLGKLMKLAYLSLSNNLLKGPIPASFRDLHHLERLSLYNNKLNGIIPSFNNLRQLRYFDASRNDLSGKISVDLLPSSILQLSLRSNRLCGSLPKAFTELRELEVLDLSYNRLVGKVDQFLFQLPLLQQLNLSHNKLTSVAVPDLSSFHSELVAVDISYNQLQGSLPSKFANIKPLSALSLSYNLFSGLVPYQYALKAGISHNGSSDEEKPLVRLLLDGNYLTGKIPAPFFRLDPEHITASFIYNCLQSCPAKLFFCKGGGQRPLSQCRKHLS
ncbi:hypothetical protein O6H91_17G044200 [Diphasiastrum complanatum]|uniref:Uncharacterized protein n=2 Tax=Diphasiastrum complanatum TaxID=34168 RepID=A0ACC2B610_DIPCM|nr:hypothetical protein O6H91_17G042800 [Diphasiastrum complanatum]KAJ7525290.1 hypothetical protein O6H91_17G044200 [Diphasiastrum complanatum]